MIGAMRVAVYARGADKDDVVLAPTCAALVTSTSPISFVDRDGPSRDRPALRKLRHAVMAGEFGYVIVRKIEDLGSTPHGVFSVLAWFHNCGVRVRSVQEPWLDAAWPAVPHIALMMSHEACEAKKRAIRSSLIRARQEGRNPGRPRKPIAPDMLEWAADAVRSMPLAEVARRCGISETTLRRALAVRREGESRET